MKKLILLSLTILTVTSCTLNDDSGSSFYNEILPIESATVPDEFREGESYIIEYEYLVPSTCHSFSNLYFVAEENTRTIAVITLASDSDDCQDLTDQIVERSFNFTVVEPAGSSYTFQFWQGKDINDEDIYLTYNIPVVN
jgi:hypothetical protein